VPAPIPTAVVPAPIPVVPDSLAGLPGTALGEFRVIEPVSPLGAATFFRALQPSLNRHVLLAVFTPEEMARPGRRQALTDQVRATAGLLHPHVLQIFDTGEDRGLAWVCMEFVSGKSLAQVLGEKGFIPIGHAMKVASQLCEGLQCGLAAGLPVGAVSPSQVWLDAEFLVKVKLFREPGSPPPPVAEAAYEAPEVLAGGSAAEPTAAVYAVGALLYHMLAATPPVVGATRDEIARRARHDTPPPLRRANIKVTQSLARVVEGALSKAPAQRPAGLRDLARDLRRVVAPGI